MAAALTPKVATGALAGAVSVILVWIVTKCGIEVPAEIASAFTTVVSACSSYFAPHSDPTPEQVTEILSTNAMQQKESITGTVHVKEFYNPENYSQPTTPL